MSKKFRDLFEGFIYQTRLIELNDTRYVLKKYSYEPGIVKWLLIKIGNSIVQVYPYVIDPLERMKRELGFMERISKVVNTPRIIIRDWGGVQIVREYVEGERLDPNSVESYILAGETLARIHDSGHVLGDSNIFNFIVKDDDGVYIVDGEQAIESDSPDYMAWDLIVFIIFAIDSLLVDKTIIPVKEVEEKTRLFIESYYKTKQERIEEILRNMLKFKIKSILFILLPPPYNYVVIKTIKESQRKLLK